MHRAEGAPQRIRDICWHTRPWQFFALTQVCWRIREEYRLLWISDLRVRIAFDPFFISCFLEFFLANETRQRPALIQVMFNENYSGKLRIKHMNLFINLHADSATTKIEAVPLKFLASFKESGDVMCKYCLDTWCLEDEDINHNRSHDHCLGREFHKTTQDNLTCEAYWAAKTKLTILDPLLRFWSNDNKLWRHFFYDAQSHRVIAKIDFQHQNIRFKITCDTPLWSTIISHADAVAMLRSWGLPEVQTDFDVDYVLNWYNPERYETDGVRRIMKDSYMVCKPYT